MKVQLIPQRFSLFNPLIAIMLFVLFLPCATVKAKEKTPMPKVPFATWLKDFRTLAIKKGISSKTLDSAFQGVQYHQKIIKLDRKQPEFTITFEKYMSTRITKRKLQIGQKQIGRHKQALNKVAKHYQVAPEIIAAIWGAESNFGTFPMKYDVIQSLATLAYDMRRRSYFTKELLAALTILEKQYISREELKGSWAGALGQTQFMPSNYLKLAQDFDNDGRRDIWKTPEDVFASIAHYLNKKGWRANETWGQQITVPERAAQKIERLNTKSKKVDIRALRAHSDRYPVAHWQALGVQAKSQAFPPSEQLASIYMAEKNPKLAFMAYHNYKVILRYNPSNYYAVSIGLLSEQLKSFIH